jgi:hypothetical protein
MSTYEQEPTFRFGPLDKGNGVILGFQASEFLVILVGVLLAYKLGDAIGGFIGFIAFIAVVSGSVMFARRPYRGRPFIEWLPLTVTFLVTQLRGQAKFRAQMAAVGHIVRVPEHGLEPERPGEVDPQEPIDPKSLPAELADIEYLEGTLEQFQFMGADGMETPLFGVAKDKRAGFYTAVLRAQGRAFQLLGVDERSERLGSYAGVFKALADDDSVIRRLQWIERAMPPEGDALVRYLLEHGKETATLTRADAGPPSEEVQSYSQLMEMAGNVTQDHELMFCITIDASGGVGKREARDHGGGDLGAMAVLAQQIGRLYNLLNNAGIVVSIPLDRRGLATMVRNGYDPFQAKDRARTAGDMPGGVDEALAGPIVRDEHWNRIETEGAIHSTYWISEWPKLDVHALFLEPLLMSTNLTRTVSMVMEVIGPEAAAKAVESRAVAIGGHEAVRDKVGQRTSHRQARDEATVERREAELAEGHTDVRFTSFVSVSVPRVLDGYTTNEERRELEKRSLQKAQRRLIADVKVSGLKAELMYGQQAEAFTCVLPFGRGLKA